MLFVVPLYMQDHAGIVDCLFPR